MVLTSNGYKRIDEIQIGDYVLTHKNKYQKVLNFYNNGIKSIYQIEGMAIDEIKTTKNHKFLVRTRYRKWDNSKRTYLRLFEQPKWKEVENISKNDYLGTYQFAKSDNFMKGKEGVVTLGNYSPSGHNASRIVDSKGIAPTVMENHGTVTATVVKDEMPKLVGGIGEKKSNGGTQYYQQDRVYDSETVAMCHCANIPNGSYNYQLSDLRIRKLTPCECFKLMGVKPSDYNKITCSNAQKYKQAGNSIVTTCLMAIYSQLFENVDYKYYIEELLKELRTN